jgi:DNA-binding NarL/FixJ family response regulator
MQISVALIDDHPLLLAGVAGVFKSVPEFNIVATGSTADHALEIAGRFAPGVMLVDLSMPGDVFSAISMICAKPAPIKVVAFTGSANIEHAVRALDAGASGYLLKGCTGDELIQAIRSVIEGETYISQSFASKVILALRNESVRRIAAQAIKLSIREEQIVKLLLRGRTNKEIASGLGISEKTVKHYMTVLMQKLQVRNRLEVVIAAQKLASDGIQRAAGASLLN